MRVQVSTTLEATPQWVATQLQSTGVFQHITAPLLDFRPARGARLPPLWSEGEWHLRMWLFGALPLGRQTIRISLETAPGAGGWPVLRDRGEGLLMRRWDHRISLASLPGHRTLYTDEIHIEARYLRWGMTPLCALFAQLFYRHRQRRWRALARGHAAPGAAPTLPHQREAFGFLLAGFDGCTSDAPAKRWHWHWLEAAHVLGQDTLALHWRSHTALLRHAVQTRDLRESAGQMLRLALVPLGHLTGRLPAGNIGRARISAFAPMEPPAAVAALVEQALQATALPPAAEPADARACAAQVTLGHA